jgi:hypothetical protein
MFSAGACAKGYPLEATLPPALAPRVRELGLVEIKQRRCRDCSRPFKLDGFDGKSRSCKGCTRKRCRALPGEPPVAAAEVVACPSCHEPTANRRLSFVHQLGLACPSCASEVAVKEELEAASRPIPLPSLRRPEPMLRPSPRAVERSEDFANLRPAVGMF